MCRETGHFCKDCIKSHWKLLKSKHKDKPTHTESHEESHSDSEPERVFRVSSQVSDLGDGIIDSGVSSHMTNSRDILVDYEVLDKAQNVYLGDGRTVQIFRRGNIHLTMVFKLSNPKLACTSFQ